MADKKIDDGNGQSQVVLETRPRTKKPSMYKVIMLNDDYTPMEFVVYVLQRFFSMSSDQATAIMLNVHQRGVGVCGARGPAGLGVLEACAGATRRSQMTYNTVKVPLPATLHT